MLEAVLVVRTLVFLVTVHRQLSENPAAHRPRQLSLGAYLLYGRLGVVELSLRLLDFLRSVDRAVAVGVFR